MERYSGELKVNIKNLLVEIGAADASIFTAIGPVYDALAYIGFILCFYAAISRRVCTKGRATAAAIHILLVVWVILLWRDYVSEVLPLFLSLVVRSLVFLVSIILIFSARLSYKPPHRTKKTKRF